MKKRQIKEYFIKQQDLEDGYGDLDHKTIGGYNMSAFQPAMVEFVNGENTQKFDYGFFTVEPLFSKGKELFISNVEIFNELRGKGYFKKIFNDIVDYAKKLNKEKVVLEPDITKGRDYTNFLTNLYKKYGFKEDESDESLLYLNLNEDGTTLYTNKYGSVDEPMNEDIVNIFERIISYMPNSKTVKVKDNCKIGGKGDGTSDACNQGEIENLEISDI